MAPDADSVERGRRALRALAVMDERLGAGDEHRLCVSVDIATGTVARVSAKKSTGVDSRTTVRHTKEHMFYQATLMGALAPRFDDSFADLQRTHLSDNTWVDWAPHWLSGADDIFDILVDKLPWRQRTGIRMYDSIVDEPRLTTSWHLEDGAPEPLAILRDMRHVLIDRYREPFDSIGFNLYRDQHDSVAWHGDRHRHFKVNPIVCLVSLGEARPFRLRPRGGGASRSWSLGHGDLMVMGGACQHDFEHTVPKLSVPCGPRISIGFRSL